MPAKAALPRGSAACLFLARGEKGHSRPKYPDFLYSPFGRVPESEFPVKQGIIRELLNSGSTETV
jgi:hypothetical protein